MIKSNELNNQAQGVVFNIQYFCIHDGPGIRTTIFLKGCPLSCIWCHNPEGINKKQQLFFNQNSCIDCGKCFNVCSKCHVKVENEHLIYFDKCNLCGKCSESCDGKALKIIGKIMTVDKVIDEILKDKKFYDNSAGGVTISGGEPMMQHDFLFNLLEKIKAYGIHAAIETSGYSKLENFIKILPFVDLFLWDYKESDTSRHKNLTGVGNEAILSNLENLYDLGAKIILRCPIIPGINDRDEHFKNIAKITRRLKNIVGAEIMPYHHYGVNKSENMGMQTQDDYGIVSENQKLSWINKIESYGGKVIKE